jgi:hypothetical protein
MGFGACGNEFSPDDGRVVAVDHGCGAHSEGSEDVAAMGQAPALVDEFSFEVMDDESLALADAADALDALDPDAVLDALDPDALDPDAPDE